MHEKAVWLHEELALCYLCGGTGCECPFRNQRCHFSGRNPNRAAPDPSDKMRYPSPARTARIRTIKKPVCIPSILCLSLNESSSIFLSALCRGRAFASLRRRAHETAALGGAETLFSSQRRARRYGSNPTLSAPALWAVSITSATY